MLAFLGLLRPLNGAMTAAAVIIGGLLSLPDDRLLAGAVLSAALSAFLIIGAGNAINDYVDVDADKVNRPERPIPSGRVKRRYALGVAVVLFGIGVAIGAAIGPATLAIAAFNTILLAAYPLYLKGKLLAGNVAVSYLVGSAFVYGGAAAGSLALPGLLMLLAFLANVAREIAKDMEDAEGDAARFMQSRKLARGDRFTMRSSRPVLAHQGALLAVGAACLAAAIALSPLPYLLQLLGVWYLLPLALADLLFASALLLLLRARQASGSAFGRRIYRDASWMVKVGMLFGLLAFLAGALA